MEEQQDKESQTEEATEKKLTDAIEHGNVPISREVSLLASLACMLIAMVFILRESAARLIFMLVHFIDDPSGWRLDRGNDAIALGNLVLADAAAFLTPIVSLLIV